MAKIAHVALKVGLEVHVELATRSKMFSRCPNPAHPEFDGRAYGENAEPNSLIDPLVLGLPGSLPVLNAAAVEMSMMVGLALGCSIAATTRWDRKSYFYPDMPKNYQISQYPLPLCFDGMVMLPPLRADGSGEVDWEALAAGRKEDLGGGGKQVGIIRAHLEEDAGKLLHEAPGGHAIDFSIVDLNRAGTPLLEIVTQPDFTSADEVVAFCQMLRDVCRFLGASEGIMQKGHMRFEPNINCLLTLDDGRLVKTPVVEVKNLNSFKAVRGAIEFELRDQPRRWLEDGREMGPGAKVTRGWDDHAQVTTVQREKEDAHDYRYFPDPDLLPLRVSREWVESVRAKLPELPIARARRFIAELGLTPKEAAAIVRERDDCLFYEAIAAELESRGIARTRASRAAANLVLQSGAKRANERGDGTLVSGLGVSAGQAAALLALRESGTISAASLDALFGLLCGEARGSEPEKLAAERNMLIVRDDAALDRWVLRAIEENAKAAEDVRAGKMQAIGRIVGAAMKLAAAEGGAADAATVKERIEAKLKP